MKREDAPSAAPARNFTIPLASRIAAYGGPPAYIARLRSIEDLEARFLNLIVAARAESLREAEAVLDGLDLDKLNRLVDNHNRYYPIEANLPIDVKTGRLMARGQPFEPRPRWTRERLWSEAERIALTRL